MSLVQTRDPSARPSPRWRLVDVFCGIGGYTCGAQQVFEERSLEYDVVGVDMEAEVLKLYAANVAGHGSATCTTRLTELGREAFDFPEDDGHTLVHFSPPCQAFSAARKATPATEEEMRSAMALVTLCMDAVISMRYTKWSLENVPTAAVSSLLQRYKEAHPELVDFGVFDARLFGCPSDRRRLIAGPPGIVRRLGEMAAAESIGVSRAFELAGWALPAQFTSNGNKYQNKLVVRGVNEPAHTITATHNLVFCDGNGVRVRCVRPAESAILVGLPCSWRLPTRSKAAQRAAGNVISPHMSRAIATACLDATRTDAPDASPSSDELERMRMALDDLSRRVAALEQRASEEAP